MLCTRDVAGLCIVVDLWKNHMEKNCCNPQYFQGKNYKAKFLTSSILKIKIDKNNFQKN
jgi:hypothetical protein